MDIAAVFQGPGIVRLQFNGSTKLGQGIIILPMAEVVDYSQGNMCFGQRRGQFHRVLRGLSYLFQLRLGERFDKPMALHSTVNEASDGQGEVLILCDGLPIPAGSLVVDFRFKGAFSFAFFEVSEGNRRLQYSGRRSGKRVRLRWRKPGLASAISCATSLSTAKTSLISRS
jgi:hypothetical protein